MKYYLSLLCLIPVLCFSQVNTWVKKADLPTTGRTNAIGFSIGSKGYIGLGSTFALGRLQDLWEYDPAKNAWLQKANFPGRYRSEAVSFVIDGIAYVGLGEGIDSLGNQKYWNDLWSFDPVKNNWERKADYPGLGRKNSFGFSIGKKGYVGGGRYVVSSQGYYSKDFWEYDPLLNKWTSKADFGGGLTSENSTFTINNIGYVCGGYGNPDSYSKSLWSYDPSLNKWLARSRFPGAGRSLGCGFSIGQKGYFGVGRTENVVQNGNFYAYDFYEFDPQLDIWVRLTDLPVLGRNSSVGFSIGTKGYLGTGFDNNYGHKQDFFEYTPNLKGLFLTGINYSSFCVGDSIHLSFLMQNLADTNKLYLELSDSKGNFTNGINLDTLVLPSKANSISGVIPYSLISGTHYRVRLQCTNPLIITPDNGYDITIYNLDSKITITSQPRDTTICIGDVASFKVGVSSINTTPIYVWYQNIGRGFYSIYDYGNFSGSYTEELNIKNVGLKQSQYLYRLRVIDDTKCPIQVESGIAKLTVIDCINTSLSDYNSSNLDYQISPNPSSSNIIIRSDFDLSKTEIKLLNIRGEVKDISPVFTDLNSISIETSDLPRSLYFLQIKNSQGVSVTKLILE